MTFILCPKGDDTVSFAKHKEMASQAQETGLKE